MSTHPGAFCIIWYACPCKHQERVWNSRDGVTPLAIICSSCGGMALQATDPAPEYDPNHKLHHGQKFFRDGTNDERVKLVDQHVDHLIRNGSLMNPDYTYTENDRSELIEAMMLKFEDGWPCVDVHGHLQEY